MSWLFSRALVEEFSAATSWDGAPSAPLSVMPTPHKFWRNDKTMEPSQLSRFGLTCAPLTESHGEALLMSYLEASRARTSASPARAMASTARDLAYGRKWLASWLKFDRDSSSWKTAQFSLLGDSASFSGTWPRWGLMLDGESYQLPTPELRICESASGLWLPTPCTVDTGSRINRSDSDGAALRPTLGAMARHDLWPTPTASLGTKGGRITPRKSREGGALIEAVSARTWATATARDWRSGKASQVTHERNSRPLSEQVGGLLNPDWVEWLMGWPIGWTALKPLETDRFHEWRQQHSPLSPKTSVPERMDSRPVNVASDSQPSEMPK